MEKKVGVGIGIGETNMVIGIDDEEGKSDLNEVY